MKKIAIPVPVETKWETVEFYGRRKRILFKGKRGVYVLGVSVISYGPVEVFLKNDKDATETSTTVGKEEHWTFPHPMRLKTGAKFYFKPTLRSDRGSISLNYEVRS
jgi:hypothetical protein